MREAEGCGRELASSTATDAPVRGLEQQHTTPVLTGPDPHFFFARVVFPSSEITKWQIDFCELKAAVSVQLKVTELRGD